MSMEHDFNLALFNLDTFFKEAPASTPDSVKLDWVKVHGLVYHQKNVVDLAEKRRGESDAAHAITRDSLAQSKEDYKALEAKHNDHVANAMTEAADAMQQREDLKATLKQAKAIIADIKSQSVLAGDTLATWAESLNDDGLKELAKQLHAIAALPSP